MLYEFRPLQWVDRETDPRQSSGRFKAKWPDTLVLLGDELRHLEAVEPVLLQVDVAETDVRLDGMLRANALPAHPGVAISFGSKFGPLRYATDVFEQQWAGAMPGWQANVRAIALALVALRAVDRYGVTKRGDHRDGQRLRERRRSADEAAAWLRKYGADELHIESGDLARLYRAMARKMHPDRGGPRADWDRLNEVRRLLAGAGML